MVHWNVVQNIEVFCKGNGEFDKVMVLWTMGFDLSCVLEPYASNVTIGFDLHCDLDLEFSRPNMEFVIYLGKKWFDSHETKSKHIVWTLGLKCDHQISHWPWPWLWIFKVMFEICYISAKKWFQHQVWPWPWPWKVRCKDLPDSDWVDFRC